MTGVTTALLQGTSTQEPSVFENTTEIIFEEKNEIYRTISEASTTIAAEHSSSFSSNSSTTASSNESEPPLSGITEWPTAKQSQLLLSVDIRNEHKNFLPAILALSRECFDEDVTVGFKKSSILHLLVIPSHTGDNTQPTLLSFASLNVRVEQRSIEVVKMAVVSGGRRRGYGRKLMKQVVSFSKNRKDIDYISLSSLPGAVMFYSQLGFKQFADVAVGTRRALTQNEELVPGQIYMEMYVGKRSRR